MEIKDFGQKIGGARKDLWKTRGLNPDDILEMNDDERKAYANRDHVWPLPNAKEQVEGGLQPIVAYWQRLVRRHIRKAPCILSGMTRKQAEVMYVTMVCKIRDMAMDVKDPGEYAGFYEQATQCFGDETAYRISTVKLFQTRYDVPYIPSKVFQQNFPWGKGTRRQGVVKKQTFKLPYLKEIHREGPNVRRGRNINADIWQKEFHFYGVEFGNYMNQKERQASMNYCYEAFMDLSEALDIDEKDIAFAGQLSLGFGSRGIGNASAHYEYLRKVINLTKMSGAGCTAHEWCHALDHQIAILYGIEDEFLASASKEVYKLPEAVSRLFRSLTADANGESTDFYKSSVVFDRGYKKDSYGRWSSRQEMFARAFACYVKDTLGRASDYLIAHADAYVFEFENQGYSAFPQGEEREILNEAFDILIYQLKQDGLFHDRKEVSYPTVCPISMVQSVSSIQYGEEGSGQLTFCL